MRVALLVLKIYDKKTHLNQSFPWELLPEHLLGVVPEPASSRNSHPTRHRLGWGMCGGTCAALLLSPDSI